MKVYVYQPIFRVGVIAFGASASHYSFVCAYHCADEGRQEEDFVDLI